MNQFSDQAHAFTGNPEADWLYRKTQGSSQHYPTTRKAKEILGSSPHLTVRARSERLQKPFGAQREAKILYLPTHICGAIEYINMLWSARAPQKMHTSTRAGSRERSYTLQKPFRAEREENFLDLFPKTLRYVSRAARRDNLIYFPKNNTVL